MADDDFDFDFAEDFGPDAGFAADPAEKLGPRLASPKDDDDAKTSPSPKLSPVLNLVESLKLDSQDKSIRGSSQPTFGQINTASNLQQDEQDILQESETDQSQQPEGKTDGFDDDSDDELLSQINDDAVFEASKNRKSPPTEENTNEGAATEERSKILEENIMGPPKSAFVAQRSQVSSIPPKSRNWESLKSFKSQESDRGSVSSTASSSVSTSSTSSSREAFFANWDTDDTSSYEKLQTIKRRFPGPAGLLPQISPSEIKLLNNSEHPFTQQISKIIASDLLRLRTEPKSLEIESHSSRDIFRITKAPWRELLKVLDINPKEPEGLLHYMNIRWVRRKVSKHPVTTKIPFLALVVQDEPQIMGSRKLKGRPKNPSIKLMDPSGTIFAAMDDKFVKMYGSELSPGTAIAVKNAGFLRFKRQVILTITRKNVICMTTMKKVNASRREKQVRYFSEDPVPVIKIKTPSSSKNENVPVISETNLGVRVIKFCDFSLSKAMEDYGKILHANLQLDEAVENDGGNCPGQNLNSNQLRLSSDVRVNGEMSFRDFNAVSTAAAQTVQQIAKNFTTAPQPDLSMDLSAFGDDDDDELMQAFEALDNIDFLINDSNNVA